MELALALLAAGPIGYFCAARDVALKRYLLLWVVILPIQTVVVSLTGDLEVLYAVLQLPILLLGVALNQLGVRVGLSRRTHVAA